MNKAAPAVRIVGTKQPLCDMVRAVLCPPFREAEGEGEDLLVCFVPTANPESVMPRIRSYNPDAAVILLSPAVTAPSPLGRRGAVLPHPFLFRDLLRTAQELTEEIVLPSAEGQPHAVFDPAGRTLSRGETSLSLTEKETAFLACLMASPGEFVPFETVEGALWPDREERKNNCRVLVSYLRRKLEAAFGPGTLVTARGRGYLLKL